MSIQIRIYQLLGQRISQYSEVIHGAFCETKKILNLEHSDKFETEIETISNCESRSPGNDFIISW